ncbi:CHASE domain-containing protein [Pseudogemmobacter sp. W21_MBD1_M6]|uniref:CHASE domain-containing protein n=1 Tax=Pseudogemmobacter sp. W21_MBD1_M6 TaxID=3240271 RepID=UPI003F966D2E
MAHLSLFVACVSLSVFAFLGVRSFETARQENAFQRIIDNSRGALLVRLQSYRQSLGGISGFLGASEDVNLAEWRVYVDALDIGNKLTGISGIGLIVPVAHDKTEAFIAQTKEAGIVDLKIHPDTSSTEKMVVKYIEPLAENAPAVGLDITFEAERRTAAELARATGTARLTGRIDLVQDGTNLPGFLLLYPHYEAFPNQDGTRGAFVGWIYAPFTGARVLDQLTLSQGVDFDLRVYDGRTTDAGMLVYDSRPAGSAAYASALVRTAVISVFGREWTLEWASTEAFEHPVQGAAAWGVLLVGFGLTGLFGAFLLLTYQREQVATALVDEKTKELTSREEENQSVIENALVSIFVLNESREIISSNQAAESLFGYSAAEMGGLPFDHLVPQDTSDHWGTALPARCRTKTGSALMLDVQMNTWSTAAGETRYTAVARDVTEQEASARHLQETERRWNLALQGAEIGVFDVNLVTGVSVVSDTWRSLMDLPVGDMTIANQSNFFGRIHPDDRAQLEAADAACLRGETERSISEIRIDFGDKGWRWHRCDAVVVERAPDGTPLRLVGAQTDVTSLRETRDALHASEERFRMLLAHAPAGMAQFEATGHIVGANGAMCQLTGYSEVELLHMSTQDIVFPEAYDVIAQNIAKLTIDSPETYQGEHRIMKKNGELAWGLISISRVTDPGNGGQVFIAQVNDITEKKQVERIKSEFVATVSHELRTPLTSIKGAIGLMLGTMRDKLPKSGERLLEIALTNTDRLIDLVNDILDLEKVSSGNIDFTFRAEDLTAIVEDAVHLIRPAAAARAIHISVKTQSRGDPAWVDRNRVSQVVINLLSNACKFSDEGGTVRITIEDDGAMQKVSVRDDGAGVPDAFRAKIFQPFSQADSSDTRAKGGTGLGLSICRQLIEQMGGQIGFDSVKGAPTSFWFTCPKATEGATQENVAG